MKRRPTALGVVGQEIVIRACELCGTSQAYERVRWYIRDKGKALTNGTVFRAFWHEGPCGFPCAASREISQAAMNEGLQVHSGKDCQFCPGQEEIPF